MKLAQQFTLLMLPIVIASCISRTTGEEWGLYLKPGVTGTVFSSPQWKIKLISIAPDSSACTLEITGADGVPGYKTLKAHQSLQPVRGYENCGAEVSEIKNGEVGIAVQL